MFAPATLGPCGCGTGRVKAATFEGRTPPGQVTDELIDHHLAVTRGGGLTTVAYLAVASEGRTHRDQIVVGEPAVAGLALRHPLPGRGAGALGGGDPFPSN